MTINRALPPSAFRATLLPTRPVQCFAVLGFAVLLLSACDGVVPRTDERQPSHPAVVVAPPVLPPRAPVARPPAPPPPRIAAPVVSAMPDWRDVPLAAGDWTWAPRPGGSAARFGAGGQSPVAQLQCDRADRVVRLVLAYDAPYPPAVVPSQARIITSTVTGPVAVERQMIDGRTALTIALPASHHLLDAMAFSRGRFVVQIDGASWPDLRGQVVNWIALPSWSEVGRVVEDCRG